MVKKDDPIVSREQWEPEFWSYHEAVLNQTPDFDRNWLLANDPGLYYAIRSAEERINALGEARLSKVSPWVVLVLAEGETPHLVTGVYQVNENG